MNSDHGISYDCFDVFRSSGYKTPHYKFVFILETDYEMTNLSATFGWLLLDFLYCLLSYDVASGDEITPCNKIDKPL